MKNLNLSEIIKMRSAPGILIFDLEGRLLYVNDAALDIMPDPQESQILEEIRKICDCLKSGRDCDGPEVLPGHQAQSVLDLGPGGYFSLRAFFIGNHGGHEDPTHIMALIEGITKKHCINFEKARTDFMLTKRELEVLGLICEGLANRDISERLFISEYTVKDHIKNIMKKMGVGSRNEIMAALD
jgi:DNA-binding CsgD family transcriptional regulator